MRAEYLRRGQGRSDRALEAEAHGLKPRTRAAKALSVPRQFIADCCDAEESHHVGGYAVLCDYYNTPAIGEALAHPEGKAVLAAWRTWSNLRARQKRAGGGLGYSEEYHRLLPAREQAFAVLRLAQGCAWDVDLLVICRNPEW